MELVLRYHYTGRKVGCRYAFGLFDQDEIIGCVCYSVPASYTLCKGVCGEQYKKDVLELSRLVIVNSLKNAASFLVAKSICMMENQVLVSYADPNVGHVGYVYQATNWIYTGQGNSEPCWLHPKTKQVISKTRRHIDQKAEKLGLNWKDLIKQPQEGKHRYVCFAGAKAYKKRAKKALRYKKMQYPKGESKRHEIDRGLKREETLF